ncbi:MAG: hypothetical protein ACR2I2_01350 [Bryobacteraceae bacterium]
MRRIAITLGLLFVGLQSAPAQSKPSEDSDLKAREDRRITRDKGYHYTHPKNTGPTPESEKESKSDNDAKRNRNDLNGITPPTYTPQTPPQAAP